MNRERLALVDGSAEHRKLRSWLYLATFFGFCIYLHLQAIAAAFATAKLDWLFYLLLTVAAVSAALAVHLREKVKSEERQEAASATTETLWIRTKGEARLEKLLAKELDFAREDERPFGLMLINTRQDDELPRTRRENPATYIAEAGLSTHLRPGSLVFKLDTERFVVVTANLDALEELEELAAVMHNHTADRLKELGLEGRLEVGVAVTARSQMLASDLLLCAKKALQRARLCGGSYFDVDEPNATYIWT